MSNTLTATIQADVSGFSASMKKATEFMKQFAKSNGDAAREARNYNGVTEEQVKAYNKVIRSMNKATDGSKTLKNEQRALGRNAKQLNDIYNSLSSTAKNSDFGKQIAESCRQAEFRVKSLGSELNKVKSNMKGMSFNFKGGNLLSNFGSGLGLGSLMSGPAALATAAGTGIAAFFKQAIDVNREFEASQSTLQAITGKSAAELKNLTDQAIALGSSTKYTATEIAGLQIELAKLGYGSVEIQNMTEHVQNFATAVGTDLSSAASMVGSSLKMFGLDAIESQRVADVLSKSTNLTSLSFDKLKTSLAAAGNIAKTFGGSIEQTVAYIGALADRGIDASTAGTTLRNLLLILGEQGGKTAKALGYTITSVDGLDRALKDLSKMDKGVLSGLVGKENVGTLMALIDGAADSANKLTVELENCTGAAKKMSDVMSDNLQGDVTRLSSAWDGLLMAFSGTTDLAREAVQWLTKLVNKCTSSVNAIKQWYNDLYQDSMAFRALVEGVVASVKINFDRLVTVVKIAVNNIAGGFRVLGKILEGDVEGAWDEWTNILKNNAEYTKRHAEYMQKTTTDALDAIRKKVNEVDGSTATVNVAVSSGGSTGKGNSGISTSDGEEDENFPEGSIGWYEKVIKDTKKKLKIAADPEVIKQLTEALEQYEHKLKVLKGEEVDYEEGSVGWYENEVKKLEKRLKLLTDSNEIRKTKAIIDYYKTSIKELQGEFDAKSIPYLELIYDQAIKHSNAFKENLKECAEEIEEYEAILDDCLNEIAKKHGIDEHGTATIPDADFLDYQDTYTFVEERKQMYNDLIAYADSAIKDANDLKDRLDTAFELLEHNIGYKFGTIGFYEALIKQAEHDIKSTDDSELVSLLKGKIEYYKDEILKIDPTYHFKDQFKDQKERLNDIKLEIDAVTKLAGCWDGLFDIIGKSNEKLGKTLKAITGLITNTANVLVQMAEIQFKAEEARALAGGNASAAGLPFPYNLVAMSTITAAIMSSFAQFASIGKFANGGIVGGNSFAGDYNIARVNSGEMILNGSQQKKLFNLLNSDGGVGSYTVPEIKLRVSGTDLVGAVNNYNNKMKKVR